MNNMNKTMSLVAALSASMLFAGCSENKTNTNAASSSTVLTFPETIVLKEKPDGAISVKKALAKIEKGKEITVSGRIAGSNCFDNELAIFSLTQKTASKPESTACEKIATESTESGCTASVTGKCKKNAPVLLIQYKGKDGKVVRSTFDGFKGLQKNIAVVVTGSVDYISTDKSLVVNLKGFYILPKNHKTGQIPLE